MCLLTANACFEKGPGPDFIKVFDQKGFITHVGNELILPAYKELSEKSAALDTALSHLVNDPSNEKLAVVRQKLKEAWLAWQYCLPYEFGPSKLLELSADLAAYPADTAQIENNIENRTFQLAAPENALAKGFAALDYLINNTSLTDEEILSNTFNFLGYKKYLIETGSLISFSSNSVYKAWAASDGNYNAIFTADQALGVNEGSSVAELVNAMCESLELMVLKSKVGIPLGDYNEGVQRPEAVEALYGGYSLELLKASVESLYLLFIGKSRDGIDSLGFDEYLAIKGVRVTDSSDLLADAINARFDQLFSAIQLANDPLSVQLQTSPQVIRQINNQLLVLLYLYKNEMAPALRVELTY